MTDAETEEMEVDMMGMPVGMADPEMLAHPQVMYRAMREGGSVMVVEELTAGGKGR